jgi:hypothetical protein
MSSSGKDRVEEPFSGESSMSTPLLLRRNQNLDQKYAQETNAMAIEEDKPKPKVEEHARDGMLNLLISMEILQRRNHLSVSGETSVETQMEVSQFGAILLTRRRGGNTVLLSLLLQPPLLPPLLLLPLLLKNAQARDAMAIVDTKSRPDLVTHV